MSRRDDDDAAAAVTEAIDTIADQLAELDPAKQPEFIFVTGGEKGMHIRTQNATVGFLKQLAVELLISIPLEDSVHAVEVFERMVDEAEVEDAVGRAASTTIH